MHCCTSLPTFLARRKPRIGIGIAVGASGRDSGVNL
jgi:hypothetical protein